MTKSVKQCHHYPEVGVPLFWPFGIALNMEEQAMGFEEKNMKFLNEVVKTEVTKIKPKWATANKELFSIRTFTLRDFSVKAAKGSVPTLIIPPYAGHTSVIADFEKKQSLVEALLNLGVTNVKLTEWHSATDDMKDFDIDNYLSDINVAVDDLGGRVNLVGLCQGGWMISLYAARFPEKVTTLVLAGAPIDTQAGNGAIKKYVHKLPFSFYEGLVATGNGVLKGSLMLEGFKNMHPEKQYVDKYVELYDHIDDPRYIKRTENFDSWYENPINLPGRWYLQVVKELFTKNEFAKGEFIGLGKKLNPKDIKCPLYLLAGDKIEKVLAKGGHIGLFMGATALTKNWPAIAEWILKNENNKA
jgi:poly(3-hydroxyalkanoate) synthetase